MSEPHDPEPLPSRDRVVRGEVREKVWASLRLGVLELPEGRGELGVKAVKIAAQIVMDLKAVELKDVDG